MKPMMLLLTIALVSGCGLTPKQLQALDGAMCTKTAGYGVTNTTTIVAGASKGSGLAVNGETCSISAAGK
jgi:hypothetical protein